MNDQDLVIAHFENICKIIQTDMETNQNLGYIEASVRIYCKLANISTPENRG